MRRRMRLRMKADLSSYVLGLLFPNRCPCCGERIAAAETVCADCAEKLNDLRVPADAWRSGQRDADFPFAAEAAVYAYDGAAKEGILSMKDGDRNFAAHLAPLLAEAVRGICDPQTIDIVTWVPVSRRRRRTQGYAHAEMLGRALAKALQLPCRGDLLTQMHSTLRQHMLTGPDRQRFPVTFCRTDTDLTGKTVLLCDDVLTSGSTMRRCAALLREMGAETVYAAAGAYRLRNGNVK